MKFKNELLLLLLFIFLVNNNLNAQVCTSKILQTDTTVCMGSSLQLTVSINDSDNSCDTYPLSSTLQNALLGWYPFCGNTNDISHNGNNGFATGPLTYTADRYNNPNDAIQFTGAGESVRTNKIDRTTTNSFSYVVWINTQNVVMLPTQTINPASGFSVDLSTPCVIASVHGYNWSLNDLHTGAGLYIASNGVFVVEHAASIVATPLSWAGSLNGWHSVAVVYDNHLPKLYVDGNFIQNGLITPYTVHPSLACDSFYQAGIYPYLTAGFGKGFDPNTISVPFNNFKGVIDDIKVFNRALTQNEITELYAKDKSAILWSTGDTTKTIKVSPSNDTSYSVTVTNSLLGSCRDTVKISVKSCTAFSCDQTGIINNDTTVCSGTQFQLKAKNALSYQWYPGKGLSDSTIQNPIVKVDSNITYYLKSNSVAGNLVSNGDFEQGNTGFFTNYIYCNSGNCLFPLANDGYSVGTNANYFHNLFTGHDHTTGNGNFMIINGADPTKTVWRETINVAPNTTYAFGCWISTMIAINPAQIRFSINGVQLGPIYNAPGQVNVWNQFYITWNSASNTTATIEIVDVLNQSNGNDFGLDDIFFGQIESCLDSLKIGMSPAVTPSLSITGSANNICSGTNVTFTATPVNGGTVPVYQWRVNGVNAGTNNPSFNSNTLVNGDIVSCKLTSSAICVSTPVVTSNSITMKIGTSASPSISINNSANNICSGTLVTFTATALNGDTAPVYQWKVNGVNVGTNSSAFISNTLANGDIVSCVLTSNSSCASLDTTVSNTVVMVVNGTLPGSVNISASSTNICSGGSVAFVATSVNGGTTPIFQWKINGMNIGSNNPTFSSNTLINGDIVSCELTSNATCVSTVNTVSNKIIMTVNTPVTPSVKISPSGNDLCAGTPITFMATSVNGGSAPVYQWKVNGINSGTNSPGFTSKIFINGDIVSCELTSNIACVTTSVAVSNNVTMNVSASVTPLINITSSANTICTGTSVTFTATTLNPGNKPNYQWKVNEVNVGTNNSTYTNNNFANGDQIACILTPGSSTCYSGSVSSNLITISINSLPIINITPEDTIVIPGSQVNLNASVSGSINSYEWAPAGSLVNATTLSVITVRLDTTSDFIFTAITNNGCPVSKIITIKVFRKLYMPNAFTPNGDGLNDVFKISPDPSLSLNEFSIYDGWGNKIFSTQDIHKGWDGTYKGVKKDPGVYVYVINGTDNKGTVLMKGVFMLIR